MFEEMVAPLFITEWGRRFGLLCLIVFGILLMMMVLRAPWIWRADYHLTHRVPSTVVTLDFADPAAGFIMQIPKQHLLGQADLSETYIPMASLQLHLIGIMLATAKNESQAIISEAGQPNKIYRVGERLSSGIKVSSIEKEGVILDNGVHLEKLPLQRVPLIFQERSKKSLLGE